MRYDTKTFASATRQNLPPTNADPYRLRAKYEEPTVCPDCRAVYHKGRWQWLAAPAGAEEKLCPACQRIHDDYPAGCVELSGSFFQQHRQEILNLVQNISEHEKREHPLKRTLLPPDSEGAEAVRLETTDLHLARELGEAIFHAYGGEFDYSYSSAENLLRVRWER